MAKREVVITYSEAERQLLLAIENPELDEEDMQRILCTFLTPNERIALYVALGASLLP